MKTTVSINNVNEVIKKLRTLEGLVAMGEDYDAIETTVNKLLKMEIEKLEKKKMLISHLLSNFESSNKLSFLKNIIEKNKDFQQLWFESQKVEHKIQYIKTMLNQ